MKRIRFAMVTFAMLLCVTAAASSESAPTIGVSVSRFDDPFLSAVRNAMEAASKGTASLATGAIVDSQNSQSMQNNNVDMLISQGVDALAINPVNGDACAEMVRKSEAAGIPIVFFGREPDFVGMEDNANWYYVGAQAESSGMMSGQILVDYFTANPPIDGVIHYVMLRGEQVYQDGIHSEYAISRLGEVGFVLEALAVDSARWSRDEGRDKMTAWLAAFGDEIDCVLGNNDDMALGAIEALKGEGYFTDGKYMPVVGVGATASALEALKDGALLGTVSTDAMNQGRAALLLAVAAATGDFTGFPYEIVNRYVWIPCKIVTKENCADFEASVP